VQAWNLGETQGVDAGSFNQKTKNCAIRIKIPPSDLEVYPHVKVAIHFSTGQKKGMPEKH